MTRPPQLTVDCTRCGRRIRSRGAVPMCSECIHRRKVSSAETNRQEAYCEHCGRWHAGRWECVERSERSAEEVRLWLMERGDL